MTADSDGWWPAGYDEWPSDRRKVFVDRARQATPLARLRYTPGTPTPKQNAFLVRHELEAFFAGSAGPGKTWALLAAALAYADVPGYAALLIRRTYPELSMPGGLIPMSQEWLAGSDARWNSATHTWSFPSGASLSFGYLQHTTDKYRYKGVECQFVGFDELTELDEEDYLYLFSRLRRSMTTPGQSPDGLTLGDVPLRMRGASNPGGPGHDWVYERFIRPETRDDRVFVPARIRDNPHLDAAAYERSLSMLANSAERRRLLEGDWEVEDQGFMFNPSLIWLVDEWSPPVSTVRYWDLAATEPHEGNRDPDWSVGARCELGSDGYATIADLKRVRLAPGAVEAYVRSVAEADGRHVPVVIEQDPGQAGKVQVHEYARHLPGWIVRPGLTRSMSKEARSAPARAAFENRTLRINRDMAQLREVLAELRRFPRGAHDDVVDAISGAYVTLTQGGVQSVTSVNGPAGRGPLGRRLLGSMLDQARR